MKCEYNDCHGNTTIRARSLDEMLELIVKLINDIGLRILQTDAQELSEDVLRIAEVIEDYRLEHVHEKEQGE